MHLLKLPDETLLHIFKITYSEPHLTFSEDWRTIISDASHKIVRKRSPRLKALSEVNSRLRRIALPFLVRSIYIESDEKLLAFASDLLSGEDYGLVSLSKLLIVRRGFADNETLSSSYALNRTLGFASNITTLHIPYPTYIDGPFLRVLASCHRLHTLWLACIGPRETHDDFSFLKTISLRWAYFWMFGNTSAEPIKALLSGDTRHTLRFLQLNLTEQCDIFSEDTSYDALRVLKLKGATPRNFDPLAFSRIFPNLLTLATVCDIPWGLSNLPGWLRSTSTIRRLSLKSCSQGVERALGSMSLLEELSITNAMNGVEFKSVCEALHDMTELRSVTLRRSVQGGPIVINDVLLLVSSAPSLQNLSLICGDELNRTNWRCSIGELAAALAHCKCLKRLHWNVLVEQAEDPPLYDEDRRTTFVHPYKNNWFRRNRQFFSAASTQIANACPEIEDVLWDLATMATCWRAKRKNADGMEEGGREMVMDFMRFWTLQDLQFWDLE